MQAIAFDLDGTLIDSAPDLLLCANEGLADFGAAPLGNADLRKMIGNGVPKLVERILAARDLPHTGTALQDAIATFSARYSADPLRATTIYPGAQEALFELGETHALAICTNKPEGPTRAILDALGLTRHFGAIIGGDSLPRRKPDPAMLFAAFDGLGKPHGLFVGDSEVDAGTAQAAGVPFALFTQGYRRGPLEDLPHDVAFDSYAGFPALARRMLRAGRAAD